MNGLELSYGQLSCKPPCRCPLSGLSAERPWQALPAHPEPTECAGNLCLGLPCRQLSANIFVCERCGAAHFCGDACTERLLDRCSELPVCPISGRCFSRMIFPWEVTPLAHLYSDTPCTPLL